MKKKHLKKENKKLKQKISFLKKEKKRTLITFKIILIMIFILVIFMEIKDDKIEKNENKEVIKIEPELTYNLEISDNLKLDYIKFAEEYKSIIELERLNNRLDNLNIKD